MTLKNECINKNIIYYSIFPFAFQILCNKKRDYQAPKNQRKIKGNM